MSNQASQTLESLAATILEKSIVLSRQLATESIPAPTFAESGHNDYVGESATLRKARYDLAVASKSLWLLAQGPEDQIISLKWAPSDTANLDVLLRFDIPEAVPLGGAIASSDLAKKINLPLDTTERMVRYAVGNGLFIEPYPGIFVHSAASAKLTRSTHLRNLTVGSCGMHARFVGRISDALYLQQQARLGSNKTLLEGSELGLNPEAAFHLAYPGYKNVFDFAAQNKRAAEIYHGAMVARANLPRWKMSHILQARDWSDVGETVIVDVGGSAGQTAMEMAPSIPKAKFIVQDNNKVALEQGESTLAKEFPELSERIEFVEYDFFKPNTVQGDYYIFRHILHDWPDEDAVTILKNLVPALKNGARVILYEAVMPEPPAQLANTWDEKAVWLEDISMLAAHNAKERTCAEYEKLFKAADPNFYYIGSGRAPAAVQSTVEFEYRK